MTASALLGSILGDSHLASRSMSHLWSLGFGKITPESLIRINLPRSSGVIYTSLIANSPQLLLTFLYFSLNSMFTSMLLGREWSGYASKRNTLRVSSPHKSQRGTYRLQLPYRYGIPLLIGSGLLHWLVSQSIFLARVDVFDSIGDKDPKTSISTC